MEINLAELVKHDLTADEYVWLYQKYEGTKVPIKYTLDKEKMQSNGWVKVTPDQIVLRRKAHLLFEVEDYDYEKHNTTTIKEEVSRVKNWIGDYRGLFPRKTNNGRLLRGTPASCTKKMETFINNNSSKGNIITKEMILRATQKYLNEQKREGFLYTKAANYFIMKEQDSMLLQYIEVIQEEGAVTNDGSDGTNIMTEDI
jgi:hypothetical protein